MRTARSISDGCGRSIGSADGSLCGPSARSAFDGGLRPPPRSPSSSRTSSTRRNDRLPPLEADDDRPPDLAPEIRLDRTTVGPTRDVVEELARPGVAREERPQPVERLG